MSQGTALVTGASAGIGEAFARRLSQEGYDLIITARRRDRLEALAKQISDESDATVDVVVADLSKPRDLEELETRAASDDRLSLLINNAGFGGYRPFVELDPDVAQRLIDVHVCATVRLTRAVLPGMMSRKSGAVVNVASLLAFSGLFPAPPMPHRATYAAAKSFVVTFTQLLANELSGTGVQAMVCCPGVVATEFHEVQGMDMSQLPQMSADDVVVAALKGLELGEVVCAPAVEDMSVLNEAFQAQLKVLLSGAGPGSAGKLATRYAT